MEALREHPLVRGHRAAPDIAPRLPAQVCFRVTRYCNAHCGFCLAPPAGRHPDAATLAHRLDWLLSNGVRVIHFCGGEPTIHHALPMLIAHVHARGGQSRLTTNGIAMPEPLLAALQTVAAPVKVSLHGDRVHHNRLVGCDAFDRTTATIARLMRAGVPTSLQATLVAGGDDMLEWLADYCLRHGVGRLSLLPFIPRGSGLARRDEFEQAAEARRALRERVAVRRRALIGRLDLRWLDFTAQPVPVVEPDGRLILEGATEARDRLLCRLPEP